MGFFSKLALAFTVDASGVTEGVNKSVAELRRMEAEARKANKHAAESFEQLKAAAGKVTLAITLAAAAVSKFASVADDVQDAAEAFDTTAASILELQLAMQQSGGQSDKLVNAMSKLAAVADKAAEGSESVRESFTRLGISGKEVENLKPDELYRRVVYAIADIEDTTKRAAIAQEILGRAAKGIDFKKQAEEIDKARGSYDEAGAAIQVWADLWDILAARTKAAVISILGLLAPLAQALMKILDQFKAVKDSYAHFKGEGGNLDFGGGQLSGEWEGAITAFDPDAGRVAEQNQKASAAKSALLNAPKGDYTKEAKKDIAAAEAARREALRVAEELQKARQIGTDFEEQQRLQQASIDYQNQSIFLSEEQRRISDAINKIDQDRISTLARIAKEMEAEEIKRRGGAGTPGKLEELKSQQIEVVRLSEQFKEAALASAQMQNKLKEIKVFSDSVWGNLSAGLDEFIHKGTIDFANFTRKIILDLIAIEAKKNALAIFEAGRSSLFGAGGISGLFGGLFGGGKAAGGPVDSGMTYLVGEKGPEWLHMGAAQRGNIIPANSFAAQNTDNTNAQAPIIFNVQTYGPKDFESWLLASRETIWKANQSMQKSKPQGRYYTQ